MEEGYCIEYSLHRLNNCRFVLPLSDKSLLMARLSSILAADTLPLAIQLHVSFDQVASLTGYFLLGVGCSAWLISGTTRIYGKRHTFVIGSILLLVGSVWGALGKSL